MTIKEQIIEYFKDQISFYTNRKKKILRNIKSKERVGLTVTELDKLQVIVETEHINRFERELTSVTFMTEKEIKKSLM